MFVCVNVFACDCYACSVHLVVSHIRMCSLYIDAFYVRDRKTCRNDSVFVCVCFTYTFMRVLLRGHTIDDIKTSTLAHIKQTHSNEHIRIYTLTHTHIDWRLHGQTFIIGYYWRSHDWEGFMERNQIEIRQFQCDWFEADFSFQVCAYHDHVVIVHGNVCSMCFWVAIVWTCTDRNVTSQWDWGAHKSVYEIIIETKRITLHS